MARNLLFLYSVVLLALISINDVNNTKLTDKNNENNENNYKNTFVTEEEFTRNQRPILIVKTIDGQFHLILVDQENMRMLPLWSTNLGEVISTNVEDVKIETENEIKLFRIIPSLEGSLFKYSFSQLMRKPQQQQFDDNDYGDNLNDEEEDDEDEEEVENNNKLIDKSTISTFTAATTTTTVISKPKPQKQQHPNFQNKKSMKIFNEIYEKIPFDMDDLLKATFLFNNDLTFTGSIKSNLVRIQFNNGKIVEVNNSFESKENSNLFIIKQTKYDLKAISIRNGTEIWNINLVKNEIIKYPSCLLNLDDDLSDGCRNSLDRTTTEKKINDLEKILSVDVDVGKLELIKNHQQQKQQQPPIITKVTSENETQSAAIRINSSIISCELLYKGISKTLNVLDKKQKSQLNDDDIAITQQSSMDLVRNVFGRASKSTRTAAFSNILNNNGASSSLKQTPSLWFTEQGRSSASFSHHPLKSYQRFNSNANESPNAHNWIDSIYIGKYKNTFYAQYKFNNLFNRFVYLSRAYSAEQTAKCFAVTELSSSSVVAEMPLLTNEKVTGSKIIRNFQQSYFYRNLIESLTRCFASANGFGNSGSDSSKLIDHSKDLAIRKNQLSSRHHRFEEVNSCFPNDLDCKQIDSLIRTPIDKYADESSSLLKTTIKSGSETVNIILIIVVTSFLSILFATLVFIKCNKRFTFLNNDDQVKTNAAAANELILNDSSINNYTNNYPSTPKDQIGPFQFLMMPSSEQLSNLSPTSTVTPMSAATVATFDPYTTNSDSDSTNDHLKSSCKKSSSKITSSSNCSNCSDSSSNMNNFYYANCFSNNNNSNQLILSSNEEMKIKRRLTSSLSDSSINGVNVLTNNNNNLSNIVRIGQMMLESPPTANAVTTNNQIVINKPVTTQAAVLNNLNELNDEELKSVYESRYLNEFQHIRLIGKGGFGYVFEAKNRIDERIYAVKRIKLKNKPQVKEKTLREVRTLAKLESLYIVRYFYSWFEYPPLDWQIQVDKRILFNKNISNGNTVELNDTFNNTQFSIETNNTDDNQSDISSSFCSHLSSLNDFNENSSLSYSKQNSLTSEYELSIRRPVTGTSSGRMSNDNNKNFYQIENNSTSSSLSSLGGGNLIQFQRRPNHEIDYELDDEDDVDQSESAQQQERTFPLEIDDYNNNNTATLDSLKNSKKYYDSDENNSSEDDDLIEFVASETDEVANQASDDDDNDYNDDDSCSIVFENTASGEAAKEKKLIKKMTKKIIDQISKDDGYDDTTSLKLTQTESSDELQLQKQKQMRMLENKRCKNSKSLSYDEHNSSLENIVKKAREKMRSSSAKKSSTRSKSSGKIVQPEKNNEFIYLYIQTELCKRETLRHWLSSNNKRKHTDIMKIFDQLLNAIVYIHSKDLVHRDLKPSNVFLSIEGVVKLGDFGLVQTREEQVDEENNANKESSSSSSAKKAQQDFDGTYLYMSPEQLKGLDYNSKVDIYSLGVILFELIVPFDTAMERIQTLRDLNMYKFPATFENDYPIEKNLIKLLIEPNPDKRLSAQQISTHPAYVTFKDAYSV